MRTSTYAEYLTHLSALIGVDQADFQTTENVFFNSFFNKAIRKIWESSNWTDICPKGEVRFPTNLITYPNDLTQSTWTATNGTATANAIQNPLDNRTTATNFVETAVSGYHQVSQSFTALPGVNYQFSCYARPNGRNWIQVSFTDNNASYFNTFFDVLNGVATTGLVVNFTTPAVAISKQANGFYLVNIAFTWPVTATNNGSCFIHLSPDGVTYPDTYLGVAGSGCYFWGITLSTPNSTTPAYFVIPWDQPGEQAIDVLFDVWSTNPGSFLPPYRVDYTLTTNGVQLIGPTSIGPVYLWYRQRRPIYTADPAQTFPYVFFEYCVYSAYSDWLETEGQSMKAQAMRQMIQGFMDDENDRQERQNGDIMPWRVYTHLTSQNRGLGYVGQNFNAGTATIN